MPDKPEFVVLVIGVCLISREGPDDLFRKGFRACFAAVNAQVISGLWIQILERCLCGTGAPVTSFDLPSTQRLDITADQHRFDNGRNEVSPAGQMADSSAHAEICADAVGDTISPIYVKLLYRYFYLISLYCNNTAFIISIPSCSWPTYNIKTR